MKPEDLESIIENNGAYILTKEQMQGILAQMNKPPTPSAELGEILVSLVRGVDYITPHYPWASRHSVSFRLTEVGVTQRIVELVNLLMNGELNV